jgi:hypothetical protein
MRPEAIVGAAVAIGLAVAGAILSHARSTDRMGTRLTGSVNTLSRSVDKLDGTVERLDAKLDDHGERIATLEERTRDR